MTDHNNPSSRRGEGNPQVPNPGRRWFFRWLTYLTGAAATLVLAVPLVGYFISYRRQRPPWIKLGPIADFPQNVTRMITFDNPLKQPWDGMVAHTGVYVRYLGADDRQQDQFLVLAVNCTHLGCPVEWFEGSGLFMCPCHGGVYYENGEHASGPPPRGLYHYVWRVRDGQLEVQAPHFPTLHDTLRDRA
jgi:Rieske Fe-S protein